MIRPSQTENYADEPPPESTCETSFALLSSGARERAAAAAPAPRDSPVAARTFLEELVGLRLLGRSTADAFLVQRGPQLAEDTNRQGLGGILVRDGLLTTYQVERVLSGTTHGLVLGNYRVLERLGSGGMGIVFLAEHYLLKRRAAVKVLPVDDDCLPGVRARFCTEMRGLADLHHPHIVMAYDAGEVAPPAPGAPGLVYLVMELVSGGDLDQYVQDHGPLSVPQACDWVRQAACGLQEAHDHHLIHRDIKPSNLMLTPSPPPLAPEAGARGGGEGAQVKVGDFGLVRQFCSRLTDPRVLLGSIDYIAPEQSHDPSAVGAEADIYGLGATLFWLLTGEPPYPRAATIGAALRQLQNQPPRRLRTLRSDVPKELDELVARMLDRDPARRPAMPLTVMNALMPFTAPLESGGTEERDSGSVSTAYGVPRTEGHGGSAFTPSLSPSATRSGSHAAMGMSRRVLIVDDEAALRQLCRTVLERHDFVCAEAGDGEEALALAGAAPFDLVLLDLNLPGIHGFEVCRRLRGRRSRANLKIIAISGRGDPNELAEALPQGADDYLAKPFEPRHLLIKVQHALQLKDAQDRAAQLADHLRLTNRQLEQSLQARGADVRQAQDALLFAMARMAESQDGETEGHLRRMQLYCRCLADEAAKQPRWQGLVDARFLEQLERCVPLHDIGKIRLPDHIWLKPGRLTPSERALMETHPVLGDQILQALGQAHGQSLSFLGMAAAIVRHHHERYDGKGYPDRLAGDAIPAGARLAAVADVYEALRRQRPYKPALTHDAAVRVMLEDCAGHFDPTLVHAFRTRRHEFERIYLEVGD